MSNESPSPPFLSAVVATEETRSPIPICPDESTMIKQTIMALSENKRIFQRAGFLVEPRLDPARKLKSLLRPTDELRMVVIKGPRLRTLSTEQCFFYKSEKNVRINVNPPDWLASAVLSQPEWPGIPVVESISENPTFRADGTIHDEPGYDDSSGNYFAPDGETFPKIKDNPTLADAQAAYKTLMDPFVNFPFVSNNDLSVVGAIILTIFARPAIAGPTPPFVIRTPTPRTGKDLLTDVITIISTGSIELESDFVASSTSLSYISPRYPSVFESEPVRSPTATM